MCLAVISLTSVAVGLVFVRVYTNLAKFANGNNHHLNQFLVVEQNEQLNALNQPMVLESKAIWTLPKAQFTLHHKFDTCADVVTVCHNLADQIVCDRELRRSYWLPEAQPANRINFRSKTSLSFRFKNTLPNYPVIPLKLAPYDLGAIINSACYSDCNVQLSEMKYFGRYSTLLYWKPIILSIEVIRTSYSRTVQTSRLMLNFSLYLEDYTLDAVFFYP